MNSSATTDTRQALRAGTRAAHGRVDAQFADGLESAQRYAAYLRGMHAFVRGVDEVLARAQLSPAWRTWSTTPRADWLQADLDALGLSALDTADWRTADAPQGDDATAAGTLYVLEGSALGARMLLDGALRLGHDAGRGASFLASHANGEQGRRWPRFAAALQGVEFDGAPAQVRVLDAANVAFARAEACFALAAAERDPGCSRIACRDVQDATPSPGRRPGRFERSA